MFISSMLSDSYMCYNICLYICIPATIKVMHLSILSPTTLYRDKWGQQEIWPYNSVKFPTSGAALHIKSPLKSMWWSPVTVYVGILIHRIAYTVKVNTCAIHRIYHIMGFSIEPINCMDPHLFNIQMEVNTLCKEMCVKFPTIVAGFTNNLNKVSCPYNPTLLCWG